MTDYIRNKLAMRFICLFITKKNSRKKLQKIFLLGHRFFFLSFRLEEYCKYKRKKSDLRVAEEIFEHLEISF